MHIPGWSERQHLTQNYVIYELREIAAKQVSVKLRFHERHSFFSIQPGLSPFLGKGKSFV